MSEKAAACLLCGEKADLRHDRYPGYQEPDTFNIYHCTGCKTAYSTPRPDSTAIYESIYRNGSRVPGYSRYWRYAALVKMVSNPLEYLADSHEDYWSVKQALSMYATDKKWTKILEIGSGLGYLTYALNTAGYNVKGMDVSETAVSRAKENFGDNYICGDLFQYSETAAGSYDIVILTEVIEHVGNPEAFIHAVLTLLKPGGKAIITTPNKSFYPEDVIWASDLPPVHCWWLGEESMEYIAGKLNVSCSFIDFTGFYKKNFQVTRIKSLNGQQLPRPFLNSRGELLRTTREGSSVKSSMHVSITNQHGPGRVLAVLRRTFKGLYGKIRSKLSSGVKAGGKQGPILCAVMHKK
jgi:SAM-dependent methyltransferase